MFQSSPSSEHTSCSQSKPDLAIVITSVIYYDYLLFILLSPVSVIIVNYFNVINYFGRPSIFYTFCNICLLQICQYTLYLVFDTTNRNTYFVFIKTDRNPLNYILNTILVIAVNQFIVKLVLLRRAGQYMLLYDHNNDSIGLHLKPFEIKIYC